jgi:cell wall-associated NlpC family hydrolase
MAIRERVANAPPTHASLCTVSSGSTSTTAAGSTAAAGLSRHALVGALTVTVLVGVAFSLVIALKGSRHAGTGRDALHARSTSANLGVGSVGGADRVRRVSTGSSGARHGSSQSARAYAPGGLSTGGASASHGGLQATAVVGSGGATVAEVRDPEESKSFPLPATVRHKAASTPSVAAEAVVAPGAASDAQIRRELGEEEHAKAQERAQLRSLTANTNEGGSSVGGNGTIPIPSNVPEAVQRVIAGGNAIADFPYIWGGGHASFVANGYDCSGSVSYALAAGGLLSAPLVSGELASWGAPGPGRWITIYANAGHTFMDVDGVWFDTAGRSGPYASRWILATPPLAGYSVRHPPGL